MLKTLDLPPFGLICRQGLSFPLHNNFNAAIGDAADNPLLRYNISLITKGTYQGKVCVLLRAICWFLTFLVQVPHLLALIKSFARTDSDASVTLRDLTGDIKGTMHKRVLETYSTEEMLPGSVLVLRQVRLSKSVYPSILTLIFF